MQYFFLSFYVEKIKEFNLHTTVLTLVYSPRQSLADLHSSAFRLHDSEPLITLVKKSLCVESICENIYGWIDDFFTGIMPCTSRIDKGKIFNKKNYVVLSLRPKEVFSIFHLLFL